MSDIEKSTDIYLDKKVLVSAQVYRNKPLLERIIGILPHIKVLHELTGNKPHLIRFCHIRGLDQGYFWETGEIEVCVKKMRTQRKMLETIGHELVHAQQKREGRLRFTPNGEYWNGKLVEHRGTYYSYRNLPWEAEAYKRQTELARKAFEIVGATV
jgi:hypothetical protein